jgi:hypothetical protein
VSWFSRTLTAAAAALGLDTAEIETLVDGAREQAQGLVQAASTRVVNAVVDAVATVVEAAVPGQSFDDLAREISVEVSRVFTDPPLPDVETPVLAEAEEERVRVWADEQPELLLEFVARIDDRTSDICRECNGTRLPAGHPWWQTYTPPLHPHCRSTVVQSTGGAVTAIPPDVEL